MRPHINPYAKFADHNLTINDHLAIDRTVLANERTFLAYGRTALAMLVIGGSAIKFFDSLAVMLIFGVPFTVGGLALIVCGWLRFRRTRRYLKLALEQRESVAKAAAQPLPAADSEHAPSSDMPAL